MKKRTCAIYARFPRKTYLKYKHEAKRLDMSMSSYVVCRCIANSTKLSHPQLRRLRARYWLVHTNMKYVKDGLATDRYLMSNILYLLVHGNGKDRQLVMKYLPKDRLADCIKRLRDMQVKVTALPHEINDIENIYRNINRNKMKGSHKDE